MANSELVLPSLNPDVTRAETLPAAAYRDSIWFERQVERVFPCTWHGYPSPELPQQARQLLPWTLLPGALDEPLLWARSEAGQLRLLSNVCTHRGYVLVEQACSLTSIRCGYHGRRFALDGQMLNAPAFETACDFPRASDHLRQPPFGALGPLQLVSLLPETSLEEVLRPVHERTGHLPWERLVVALEGCREYEVRANWALWCDNYLEGLHIPYLHPTLNGAIDMNRYETLPLQHGSLQIGLASGNDHALSAPPGHPDHGRAVAGYYFHLFPTTMINIYSWGLSINLLQPLAPERTRITYLTYVWNETLRERGAGAKLDQVELEDDRAVERTARGMRSRLYGRGRYSPAFEAGVHRFHQLLLEAMA